MARLLVRISRVVVLIVCLLLPSHAFGAWVKLATAHGQSTNTTDATTGTFSGSGGDLITVIEQSYNNNGMTPIDSSMNSYSVCSDHEATSNTGVTIFYKQAPTVTGSMTVSVSGGAGFYALEVVVWSGSGSSPCDMENGATGSGSQTTIQPGSITPSQDNSLIILGCANNDSMNAGTMVNSGFTITDDVIAVGGQSVGGAAAYLVQMTATAVNPTCTVSNNTIVAAAIASFKPGSSPPPATSNGLLLQMVAP